VAISGSGFAPNEASLVALECLATATTVAGCNTSAIDPVTVDANGNFTLNFFVQTGTTGNGTCGTSATDATCVIAIGNSSTSTVEAFASIAFNTGPGVEATPSTGLANGGTVALTGSGFTAGDSLYAVECLKTATSSAGCDTATATPITAGSDGTLPSTSFKVATGTVGNGTCGTSATDYNSCVIEVANASGGDEGISTIDFSLGSSTTPPAGPTVSVSPSTGLKNGQSVTVTGSGFTAGDSLFAVECLASATGQAGCDIGSATAITANADGTLPSTTFTVATGTIGTGTCGTSSSNLTACVINVATTAGTDAGTGAITFAAPTTSVKPPKATKVTGVAVPGKTVTVTISGTGFTKVAKITGHAGTTATVTKTAATRITVKVKEAKTGKKGTYVFTIKFASGKTATVKYTVK
jgi:hypothetical protein